MRGASILGQLLEPAHLPELRQRMGFVIQVGGYSHTCLHVTMLGYTAIAVDMYGTGKSASHPKDAMSFMDTALAEPEKMNTRFDAALAILRKQPSTDSSKLFAIGYCFGGAVVLNQARRGLDLAGVAIFDGSLGTETKVEPGTIKTKVLVATVAADGGFC
jgi:dienelactone hydrolase